MSKPAIPKFLIISSGYADVVVEAVQASKMSTFTPAQREKIPGLLRELGRYVVAPADELADELTEIRKQSKPASQQKRPVGRPPKAATT